MTDVRGFKYQLKTLRDVSSLKLSICESDLKRCTEALKRCSNELDEVLQLREMTVKQWRAAGDRDDVLRLSAYGVSLGLLLRMDREIERISQDRVVLERDVEAAFARWTLASRRVTQLDDDFAHKRDVYRQEAAQKESLLADASWLIRPTYEAGSV